MNIAICYEEFYEASGGIETHVRDLIKMDSAKFDIITRLIPEHSRHERLTQNTNVHRYGPLNTTFSDKPYFENTKAMFPVRFVKDLLVFPERKELLRSVESDIVHFMRVPLTQSLLRVRNVSSALGLFKADADFVKSADNRMLTLHGLSSAINESSPNRKAEKRLVSLFNKIICVDRRLVDIAREYSPDADITFIPNAVNCKRFAMGNVNEGRPLRVGFVGRFEKSRGVDYLISAMKELSGKMEFVIVCAGRKIYIDRFKKAARGLDYSLVENVPYRDIHTVYPKFDVLLNPVLAEGISRVSLEAMACGRPPMMLDKGDRSPTVHEKTGLLFKNTTDIVDGLKRLAADRGLLKEMAINGRKAVEREYSQEVFISKMKGYYQKMLK